MSISCTAESPATVSCVHAVTSLWSEAPIGLPFLARGWSPVCVHQELWVTGHPWALPMASWVGRQVTEGGTVLSSGSENL